MYGMASKSAANLDERNKAREKLGGLSAVLGGCARGRTPAPSSPCSNSRLRFPRVKRVRYDKGWEVELVRELLHPLPDCRLFTPSVP